VGAYLAGLLLIAYAALPCLAQEPRTGFIIWNLPHKIAMLIDGSARLPECRMAGRF
jgi:hypothetical protein